MIPDDSPPPERGEHGGSRHGLGNLWGFSYKASSHGGAAFVLVILLVVLPLLLVELTLVALALWASPLSGAAAGYRFYLQPDFSDLLRWPTITAAAGHAFALADPAVSLVVVTLLGLLPALDNRWIDVV